MTQEESKQDDNQDMTLEERENWLRERGVIIENPHDRKRQQAQANDASSIVHQVANLSLDNDSNIEGVKFVCIPHDDSKPIQALTLPQSVIDASAGDRLPDFVKAYFADNKSIDASLLQEQAVKQFAGGDLKDGLPNLSAASMNAAAAVGSVETFPLVHPADTNQFQGVYVYLDEVGLLKKLPNNTRASQIAATCGFHPTPNFYGDVFLGRVQTKPKLHNVDFVPLDTSGNAEWMRRAVSENLAWQQELNKVTGKTGETQPSHAGTDGNVQQESDYSWTQDDDEVEITIPFGQVPNKKLIKANFLNKLVKVQYDGTEKVVIKLYGGIDVDGCTWTIDGSNLIITLQKADPGTIWPRVQA